MPDPNLTSRLAELGEANDWPPAVIELLRHTSAASGAPSDRSSEATPDPVTARIVVVGNGPLVADEIPEIADHLGCPLDLDGPTLLCRCGKSEIKPRCDASCVRDGFDDVKDPDRVPDRRDTHIGLQVTVLDNRGICQHSGLCTDRLATVFHADGDPFVTASGGRLDEIIRAVRDCPSGALSYAIDDAEARDQVDWGHTRAPAVEVSRDGPYRITGSVELVDEDGVPIPRATGASTEHYALCRCGHSRNKPFCSGMHYYVDFRDPVPNSDTIPSVFEWAGGLPALTRMTRIFYERYVPADDLLAPVFAGMSADHPQRVARWLAEVFGGPALYSTPYGGYHRMISEHRGRQLTEEQRARWVELLIRSARDAGLPNDPEFRSALGSYLEWGSRLAVENSQTDARPPQNMPMPHWDWSTAAGPPGSRISALNPTEETGPPRPVHLPGPDDPVSFATHIQPLFRDRDRRSMLFAFDLWDYDQVREHGEAIAERLRAGTMPCDGQWPVDHVDVFIRWLAEDAAP